MSNIVVVRHEWDTKNYRVLFCGFGFTEHHESKVTEFLRAFARPRPIYGYYVVESPNQDVAACYLPVGYLGSEGFYGHETRVLFSATRELYVAVHASYYLDVSCTPGWAHRIIEYPYLLPILYEHGPERAANAARILGLDLQRRKECDL